MQLVKNKELKRRKDNKKKRLIKSLETITIESKKEKKKQPNSVVSIRISKEVKEMLNVIANLDEQTNGDIFEELVTAKYERIYTERIKPILEDLDKNKERMIRV